MKSLRISICPQRERRWIHEAKILSIEITGFYFYLFPYISHLEWSSNVLYICGWTFFWLWTSESTFKCLSGIKAFVCIHSNVFFFGFVSLENMKVNRCCGLYFGQHNFMKLQHKQKKFLPVSTVWQILLCIKEKKITMIWGWYNYEEFGDDDDDQEEEDKGKLFCSQFSCKLFFNNIDQNK
jgi:hypothetical protein